MFGSGLSWRRTNLCSPTRHLHGLATPRRYARSRRPGSPIRQDADGLSHTGVVTKTKLNGDSEPTLVVGNMDVQLSKVTEVQQTSDSDTSKEA